jgi:CheY-like chemotaxis protein
MNMKNQDMVGRSVLIVDDDTFFHAVLGQMLAVLGIRTIYTASNGNEALRVLKALPQPTDYLICDVFMPDMDGIEFLNELASNHYRGAIMMVSGLDPEMLDLSRFMAAHNGLRMVGAFVKPIALQQLAEAMEIPYSDADAG